MKKQLIELLKKDVVPALGCTEPVCVALCAAYAGEHITADVSSVEVMTNAGIYKNGMSAGIPNCSEVGLHYAAAIGAFMHNPKKGLELFEDISEEILDKVSGVICEDRVSVAVDTDKHSLYVKCTIRTASETVAAVISDAHTNLVSVEKNGEMIFDKKMQQNNEVSSDFADALKEMKISEICRLIDTASEEELKFLLDGVDMNNELAEYSEKVSSGVGIAEALRKETGSKLLADDLMSRILLRVSSAAESRLDGCPLPTMSSSGSGTKGLVVILPVSETAKMTGASKEKTVRALAIAHLINRYINAHTGKLSPMCSCVMASSTAAAAAITYLLGGTYEQMGWAIRNMSGTVTGMICDGGKVGCALKVATGSAAALICALTAVNGAALRVSDGICDETPEQSIRNMARIGINGMGNTDNEIIGIMLNKSN